LDVQIYFHAIALANRLWDIEILSYSGYMGMIWITIAVFAKVRPSEKDALPQKTGWGA
jgi:hypothetical protein